MNYAAWIYLSMLIVSVCLFYYGANIQLGSIHLIGLFLGCFSLFMIVRECETELITRHKQYQDVTEEQKENG